MFPDKRRERGLTAGISRVSSEPSLPISRPPLSHSLQPPQDSRPTSDLSMATNIPRLAVAPKNKGRRFQDVFQAREELGIQRSTFFFFF